MFSDKFEEYSDEYPWSEYIERLDLYFEVNKIVANSEKRANLLTLCGAKTYSLIKNLVYPQKSTEKCYEELCELVQEHLEPKPKPSKSAARFIFYRRNQLVGESACTYIKELKKLCEDCQFGNLLDEALCDKLVCGLTSQDIQQQLLNHKDLTFEKAVEIVLAAEPPKKEPRDFIAKPRKKRVKVEDEYLPATTLIQASLPLMLPGLDIDGLHQHQQEQQHQQQQQQPQQDLTPQPPPQLPNPPLPVLLQVPGSITPVKPIKYPKVLDDETRIFRDRSKHPLLPPCTRKCHHKCTEKFTEPERRAIHEKFWNLSYNSRRLWFASNVARKDVKRRIVKPMEGKEAIDAYRRKWTRTYHLTSKDNCNVPVCKIFFLATLGYKQDQVLKSHFIAIDKYSSVMGEDSRPIVIPDGRGKAPSANKLDRQKIVDHIESFNPQLPQDNRENPNNIRFLPKELNVAKMHKLYLSSCETGGTRSCGYQSYRSIFVSLNISFYENISEKRVKRKPAPVAVQSPKNTCKYYTEHIIEEPAMHHQQHQIETHHTEPLSLTNEQQKVTRYTYNYPSFHVNGAPFNVNGGFW